MKFYESQKDKQSKYPDLEQKQKPRSKVQQKKDIFPSKTKKQQKQQPLRNSVFLKKEQQQQGWFKKLCACTQLQYYKDYFKVTNKDVKKRIMSNLQFWQGKFFQPLEQDYDFYGPFWIHTTIIFCLGAVHNILQYQGNKNFQYNYQILGQAFFLMYVLGFGLPLAIGFILKALGLNNTIFQILCLYGYSSSIYILAIILCSFNICLLHWIFLTYGAVNKFYFLFKNLNQGFQIPASKKIIVTVIIAIQTVLQVLLFKIRFIQCVEDNTPILIQQKSSHMLDSLNNEFMHSRSFNHQIGGEIVSIKIIYLIEYVFLILFICINQFNINKDYIHNQIIQSLDFTFLLFFLLFFHFLNFFFLFPPFIHIFFSQTFFNLYFNRLIFLIIMWIFNNFINIDSNNNIYKQNSRTNSKYHFIYLRIQ